MNSPDIKDRELALEERRLELDESFPRKWGPVLFSALATVAVACISAAVSFWQLQETQRAADRAADQKTVENARLALSLYFENASLLDDGDIRSAQHLSLIATVSDNADVKRIFLEMRDGVIAGRRANEDGAGLAKAAEGLPSLAAANTTGNWAGVTAYIQYPGSTAECREAADGLLKAVAELGLRTPGIESIEAQKSPDDNEIRYYGATQRLVRMDGFKAELERTSGLAFEAKDLSGNLPADILEIWIGRNAC